MDVEALVRSVEPSAERPVVLVTGAGMSVASGIPTFRGKEGYWTVGAREYHPQEMATNAAFRQMPREVWRWYLYRRHVCNAAEPNPGHRTCARIEAALGDGFGIVTQNVDGLHVRGGCRRVFEIHGSIDWMRDLSTGERLPIPDGVGLPDRAAPMTDALWERLVNPSSGARCRPHVLWFDESYDEENYRFDSSMDLAARASLIVVCGTSGAANAPYHAVHMAIDGGAVMVDIGPEENPFRDVARRLGDRGAFFDGGAVEGLARVAAALGVTEGDG